MKSKELMGYIDVLNNKKIRDGYTKKKIKDLIDKLNTLRISTSFSYNQITKLRGDLKNDPLEKDEYSDYSFIPSLKFYFDANDNFVSLINEQTNLLSGFIEELIDKIDSIKDESEDKILKEVELKENLEETELEETNKEPEQFHFDGEEFLEEDAEEDEEIAVPISNYIFKCENCGNDSINAYMSGCEKCGEHIFKVCYL